MKKLFLLLTFTSLFGVAFGQYSVTGHVKTEDGTSLSGATVIIEGTTTGVFTDDNGDFSIRVGGAGTYTLVFSYIGYDRVKKVVTITNSDVNLTIVMEEYSMGIDKVVIPAFIPKDNKGSYTDVSGGYLESNDFGQDVPILLNTMPSVVTHSDAGAGIGYTSMRIRGVDQTGINVTINGIPLNDAESHNVFWVDLPDLGSSTGQVQIQRGVGSSANGSAAFGASINMTTNKKSDYAYARAEGQVGSFGTFKHSIEVGSGKFGRFWNLEGRYTGLKSDGFIDRGSSDLTSGYGALSFEKGKTEIKAIAMLGYERTYQAWWGVPEAKLNGDEEALETHIINGQYSDEDADNLRDSDNRTYNYYDYEDEVDDYKQDHYQLLFKHQISSNLRFNGALHYTYGRGFYEQYRDDDDYADYLLASPIMMNDTIQSADFIRRRWLDNNFYGATGALSWKRGSWSEIVLGGGINQYDGDHFGRVIWDSEETLADEHQYYFSNADKQDANVYLRASRRFWRLYATADLQFRSVNYSSLGTNNDLVDINFDESYQFFNPKLLLTYRIEDWLHVYVNGGIANREPIRQDFEDADTNNQPQAESLTDIEAGVEIVGDYGELKINFYNMAYKDQLVITGAVNDVGEPVRKNVDNSYRRGVEVEYYVPIGYSFYLNANLTYSQSKIDKYESVVVDYTNGYDLVIEELTDTDIAFSPNIIAGSGITWWPEIGPKFTLASKYVGEQYLDNTASDNKSIDAFFVNDLTIDYTWWPTDWVYIDLGVRINNILDEEYEANGYTYSYIWGDLVTENFYFPQAGRNFMFKAAVNF